MSLYDRNIALLRQYQVPYREVEHVPVLDYPTAKQVRGQFGLTGIESKSLFLRFKDRRYGMFVSLEGVRADIKRIRDLAGSRPSVATDEELIAETGCVPGCACPFGHKAAILLIIDRAIFQHEKLLYSPGPPERTLEVATRDIARLLPCLPNRVAYYNSDE